MAAIQRAIFLTEGRVFQNKQWMWTLRSPSRVQNCCYGEYDVKN